MQRDIENPPTPPHSRKNSAKAVEMTSQRPAGRRFSAALLAEIVDPHAALEKHRNRRVTTSTVNTDETVAIGKTRRKGWRGLKGRKKRRTSMLDGKLSPVPVSEILKVLHKLDTDDFWAEVIEHLLYLIIGILLLLSVSEATKKMEVSSFITKHIVEKISDNPNPQSSEFFTWMYVLFFF